MESIGIVGVDIPFRLRLIGIPMSEPVASSRPLSVSSFDFLWKSLPATFFTVDAYLGWIAPEATSIQRVVLGTTARTGIAVFVSSLLWNTVRKEKETTRKTISTTVNYTAMTLFSSTLTAILAAHTADGPNPFKGVVIIATTSYITSTLLYGAFTKLFKLDERVAQALP